MWHDSINKTVLRTVMPMIAFIEMSGNVVLLTVTKLSETYSTFRWKGEGGISH
jgi:hypothetical protein